ncbi:hypothetical protein [Aliarcobacter cryaerophilus]|uniref:hypothetical protein n=1 Tax=Aliarcobacter cryaerophilus TaxID=28198 RepID=UPI0021B361CB|nr:hypothetical protein [Aliarcobacter cryaerophilus]MCT7526332.1 hypothetical protein [Aliarcobacter cryaerophilus]MCT7541343.1 hypothetical protein [Aliarcobacter cryaerophilus]
MSLILILYFRGFTMLTTLGTMLLKNRKLTKEEVEEKARIRKKLIEERRKRIENSLNANKKIYEIFGKIEENIYELK